MSSASSWSRSPSSSIVSSPHPPAPAPAPPPAALLAPPNAQLVVSFGPGVTPAQIHDLIVEVLQSRLILSVEPLAGGTEAFIVLDAAADVGRILRRLKEEQSAKLGALSRLVWERNPAWTKPSPPVGFPVPAAPPHAQLFVGNIDFVATEAEIRALLSPIIAEGEILDITLVLAKGRAQTRPAFITLDGAVDVPRALEELRAGSISLRGHALRFDLNQKPGQSPSFSTGTPKGGAWRSRVPNQPRAPTLSLRPLPGLAIRRAPSDGNRW